MTGTQRSGATRLGARDGTSIWVSEHLKRGDLVMRRYHDGHGDLCVVTDIHKAGTESATYAIAPVETQRGPWSWFSRQELTLVARYFDTEPT
jgi:hypothetical protein